MVITTVRSAHKWLMRFVGLQFILWALSGLYMVCMNIHFIHGETLTRTESQALTLSTLSYPLPALLHQYPDATNIELTSILQQPVYRFNSATGQRNTHLVNAQTGEALAVFTAAQAGEIAMAAYTGTAGINAITPLLSRTPQGVLRPLWVVTFSDFAATTLYIEQQSGRIIRRRHHYWYVFDWLWRLHIMDYDDGENVTNPLLRVLSLAGLFAAFSGVALLVLRLFAVRRKELT